MISNIQLPKIKIGHFETLLPVSELLKQTIISETHSSKEKDYPLRQLMRHQSKLLPLIPTSEAPLNTETILLTSIASGLDIL